MKYKVIKKQQSGFSIVEFLVAMFILILMGLTIFYFQKDVFSFNGIISGVLNAQDETRRALKIMTAEIRTASPSSIGAYPVSEAATSSFIFYSNINSDSYKERVRYFLEGTTLKKGVINPSGSPLTYNPANETVSELVHDIANAATPIFSYYDENYDGTTQPLAEPINASEVLLVKITIIIDKNSARPPSPITMTTQISMRNIKDNL